MADNSAARQRILSLLDRNSFVETGAGIRARATDLFPDPEFADSDGVITGYGTIENRPVYVYSQDASVLGGSIGEMHAKKIARTYEQAVRTGAPVIGFLDSTGLRLKEGVDALDALAGIYAQMAAASGVVPQISAVFGKCGGGLALAASMSDFLLMEKDAVFFVNAPNTLAGNVEENNNTASAAVCAEAGSVDFVGEEGEVLQTVRMLVSLLPSNTEDTACAECLDDRNRDCPGAAASAEDPAALLCEAADQGQFLELKAAFAKDVLTGIAGFGGMTAGVVANAAPRLSAGGCRKASGLVRFCDAFGVPVLSLTNVAGFAADTGEEGRLGEEAGRLAMTFAGATVPRINVITRRAVGSAYAVMNPKGTGADVTLAFPEAVIGPMDPDMAARIIASEPGETARIRAGKEFAERQASLESAAARGLVDQVIDPADLRRYVICALEILYTKRSRLPARKHTSK